MTDETLIGPAVMTYGFLAIVMAVGLLLLARSLWAARRRGDPAPGARQCEYCRRFFTTPWVDDFFCSDRCAKLGQLQVFGKGPQRRCHKCGCTDIDACVDTIDGGACWWVNGDTCSACATPAQRERAELSMEADALRAQKAMAGEYFCPICGCHGDDQAAIEGCAETDCGFKVNGVIVAPYQSHPDIDTRLAQITRRLQVLESGR